MPESRFQYTLYIRATPEQVWAALTEPISTKKYWFQTQQKCEWTKGAAWSMQWGDDLVADVGEVLDIDEPNRGTFTWQHLLDEESKAEGHSVCTYELRAMGSMTMVHVTHTLPREHSKLIANVSQGWPIVLSSLKTLLETGESLEATRKLPTED
jgi:uncharacterized protein YndB with AHSA1/START domain